MEKIRLDRLTFGIGNISDNIASEDIYGVVVDSRSVEKGYIFVAIKGENVDGHEYSCQALDSGAVIVVVERELSTIPKDRQLIVNSSLDAMIAMGKNYRECYGAKMVGVTGSVGKTTTKEFIHSVLSSFGKTLKNEGNRNNEIGLPETLFHLNESYDYGVLEMGMSEKGDILKLTDAVKPHIGVITNIGYAHIEHLKTRENIRDAKLEIVEGIRENGSLIINVDNDMLCNIKVRDDINLISVAIDNAEADIVATEISATDYDTNFNVINNKTKEHFVAQIPALGKHNVYNALSAYAVAYMLGLDGEVAIKALKNYQSCGMRQRIVPQEGFVVIEDCYNANPDSMRAAIDTLAAIPGVSYRIAVLGDMLELGDMSQDAHRDIGKHLIDKNIDAVVAFGNMAEYIAQEAQKVIGETAYTNDRLVAMDYLNDYYKENCAVLFKASRGMQLEEIMELFYRQRG